MSRNHTLFLTHPVAILAVCVLAIGTTASHSSAHASSPRPAVASGDAREVITQGGALLPAPKNPAVIRSRMIELDIEVLYEAMQTITRNAEAKPRLSFAFFDDVSLTVEITGAALHEPDRFVLHGRVPRLFGSLAVISVNENAAYASVFASPVGVYEVRGWRDGFIAQEIDESHSPGCGVTGHHGIVLPHGNVGQQGGQAAGGGPGSTIKLMIVYTPKAVADAGGEPALVAFVDSAIFTLNLAFGLSQTQLQAALVLLKEVGYVETGVLAVDVDSLQNPNDGVIDEIHGWRENVCADFVAMLIGDPEDKGDKEIENDACGIAFVMQTPSVEFAEFAFSVTDLNCGVLTFAHEIGHNMGCQHAHDDDGGMPGPGTYAYSHGYRFFADDTLLTTQYRTIMATGSGIRIPYYSNPLVNFNNAPTGVFPTLSAPAHNALSIDQNASISSAFGEWICTPFDVPITVPGDFATIQAAINAAQNGSHIVVASGTYNETINLLGKSIHLRSANGAAVTTIDAQGAGSVVTCISGEEPGTVIEGFTLTGGTAVRGGGIRLLASSPTFIDCVISDNFATWGGGMSNQLSNPTILSCTFEENTAVMSGGGMYNENSHASIFDCTIDNNSADQGGGIANISSSPNVILSTITNNTADTTGGGIFSDDGSQPTVQETTICDNSPNETDGAYTDGGGNDICDQAVFVPEDFPTIQAAIDAASDGGTIIVSFGTYTEKINLLGKAVHLRSSDGAAVTTIAGFGNGSVVSCISGEGSGTVIEGFTITNGQTDFGGGARIVNSNPTFMDCIVEGNTASVRGGGFYLESSSATITDCIVRDNSAVLGGGVYMHGSNPLITGCTIEGNAASGDGGGMMSHVQSTPIVSDSIFEANVAGALGGGVASAVGSQAVFQDCSFRGNVAKEGGGAHCSMSSSGGFIDTLFCENVPDHVAGSCNDFGGNSFLDTCPPADCGTADLNCDGVINGADLAALLSNWGECLDCEDCFADLNDDCEVDGADIAILLSSWG